MSKKNLPKIRIKFGWHLDPIFQALTKLSQKIKDKSYPGEEEIEKKVESYKAAWISYEEKILKGISDILELEFFQDIIDVYIVGRAQSFSDPMIVASTFEPDEFIDVLTHELLHRLLTDNTKKLNVVKIWSEMFPRKERLTRNHIILYAVHKYLYLEVLKEEQRFKQDIERTKNPEYKDAWNIVEEEGYEKIIDQFKKYYAQ